MNELQPVNNYTPEQIELIKNTVAKKATPDEFKLFIYRCNMMGLNPLKPGQIHFIKYDSGGVGSIVIGIEGFRSIAARTKKLSGISRGAIKDESGKLKGAWAEVSRSDWTKPAREEVSLSEYNTGKAMWAKMPETMIKKVAECAALRMAFPDDLGGVYESAEMDQAELAEIRKNPITIEQPAIDDGGGKSDGIYRYDFGTHKNKSCEEIFNDEKIGPEVMGNYVELLLSHIDNGKYADKHPNFLIGINETLSFLSKKGFEEMVNKINDNREPIE